MDAPRTKVEAIYHEVLGEVGPLVKEIAALTAKLDEISRCVASASRGRAMEWWRAVLVAMAASVLTCAVAGTAAYWWLGGVADEVRVGRALTQAWPKIDKVTQAKIQAAMK